MTPGSAAMDSPPEMATLPPPVTETGAENGADVPNVAPVAQTAPTIHIKAGRSEALYWRDLWRFRELLFVLAYRNISVQYKQTVIGVAWALIRPLSTMLVFVLVFSKIAHLDSDGMPYALMVLAGMLPWQLFASVLGESSNSLVANSNLISKVYFPRLIVPLSSIGVGLIDFLICLPILAGLMIFDRVVPTWRIVFFPVFVALALVVAYSLSLWLCALNVRYRDVRYIIPFLVQFGLYVSPVGYSSSNVTEWRWLYGLNPMAGVIDGVRWSLFGPPPTSVPLFAEPSFAVSLVLVVALFLGGIRYFRRTERSFADVI